MMRSAAIEKKMNNLEPCSMLKSVLFFIVARMCPLKLNLQSVMNENNLTLIKNLYNIKSGSIKFKYYKELLP